MNDSENSATLTYIETCIHKLNKDLCKWQLNWLVMVTFNFIDLTMYITHQPKEHIVANKIHVV